MARKTPFPANARTKEFLEAAGYTVGKVETWVMIPKHPCGGIKRDLWNVFDYLAVRADTQGVLAIQATADRHYGVRSGNNANHRKKVLASPEARVWCAAGNRIWLMMWIKPGARWEPRIETIDIDSFKGHERVDNSLTAALAPRAGSSRFDSGMVR